MFVNVGHDYHNNWAMIIIIIVPQSTCASKIYRIAGNFRVLSQIESVRGKYFRGCFQYSCTH